MQKNFLTITQLKFRSQTRAVLDITAVTLSASKSGSSHLNRKQSEGIIRRTHLTGIQIYRYSRQENTTIQTQVTNKQKKKSSSDYGLIHNWTMFI